MKRFAFALAFLLAALVEAQPTSSLFQNVKAIPGAAVGDLYCTSAITGQIVRIPNSSTPGYVLTAVAGACPAWAASTGGVTSISASAPIVVTPSPITGTGTISCPTCVTAVARYELSTTAANGVTSTFSFPVAVTSVTTVFVGGVAQTPSDISISGGNIILGANITPPPAGVEVSALYNGAVSMGGGTVTSLGASGPSGIFSWANSPITSSGTLTASLVAQAKNKFLVGPTSGSDAAPTFRLIDPADVLPSQGGTGANNTATAGRYLKGDGTNFVTSSGSASGVGNCPTGPQQFVTGTNSDAAPTCTTITGGMISGAIADVQDFTAAGTHTWTKPFTTGTVLVECIGAGGGAASGSVGVFNSTAGNGGPAGGGGDYRFKLFKAADLSSSVTVTVGTHGNGGAAVSGTTTTTASVGTSGTSSSFGTYLVAHFGCGALTTASGAGGGDVGDCSTSTGGAPRSAGEAIAGQGADGVATGVGHNSDRGGASGSGSAANGGGSSIRGGSGGGNGGTIGSTCGGGAPGAGGATDSYTTGAAANAGTTEGPGSGCAGTGGTPAAGGSGTGSIISPGPAGGGGGGFDTSGHAGYDGHLTMAGGNGGVGSGGGGGGGILWRSGAAVTSGKGGDGGDGACRITAIP